MTDHDELLARGTRWLAKGEGSTEARQLVRDLRAALATRPEPLFEGTPVELRRWLRGSYASTEVNTTTTTLAVYTAVADPATPDKDD